MTSKAPLEKIKEQEKVLERIQLLVPGFSGYKAKEQRREADKIVRNHLTRRLQDARNMLQDAFQALTDRRVSHELQTLDRLMAVFDRVSEKVNHASYGYAGFFDAIKIDEPELDRMLDFDSRLFDGVKLLADQASLLKREAVAGRTDSLHQYAEELRKSVEDFERLFDERGEVIRGVEVK